MPGQLTNPNKVLVDVGTGYYVEKVRVLIIVLSPLKFLVRRQCERIYRASHEGAQGEGARNRRAGRVQALFHGSSSNGPPGQAGPACPAAKVILVPIFIGE